MGKVVVDQEQFAFDVQRGILLEVTKKPGITRSELAEKLNCGTTTVHRYIRLMIGAGSLLQEPETCGTLRVTVPHIVEVKAKMPPC